MLRALGFIELSERRNSVAALQYFRQAIEHYPAHDTSGWLTQLHIRVSRAYLDMGQHEEALSAAHRALRDIQGGSTSSVRAILPEAHKAVGDVLAAMPGGEAEAIKHFLRFLQSSRRPPGIDVTWSQVHETIGQLSFKLERYQEAIDAYEKALEYNPYHPGKSTCATRLLAAIIACVPMNARWTRFKKCWIQRGESVLRSLIGMFITCLVMPTLRWSSTNMQRRLIAPRLNLPRQAQQKLKRQKFTCAFQKN